MEMIKPSKVIIYLCIVFGVLGLVALVFPKDGIQITPEFGLKFTTLERLFLPDTIKYADVDKVLMTAQDSSVLRELNSIEDSIKAFKKFAAQNPRRIYYAPGDSTVLYPLFEALEKVETEKDFIHILHYGDSQIEMDRITGYIREELQQKFGGSGPGLQPPLQVIPATHVKQSSSGDFIRYSAWGDSTTRRASHGRYGVMYNFCELPGGGTISFAPSQNSYDKAKKIDKVRVLLGNNEEALSASVSVDGKTLNEQKVAAGTFFKMLEWTVPANEGKIRVNISGGGSPEIYGISLDGATGVSVDNMPMRGCSGTIFTRGDSVLLEKSLAALNVKLIIFQFGGNMMPSISGSKSANEYGAKFYKQLMYIKSIRPDISILTIGLADMSKRINGQMQSFPYIAEVRDALKKATFDAGGAYWDMFEAMGGINSMPGWVERNPPLAGKDYIHFTTRGAQKVSEWFYEALINDYQVYRLEKRIKAIQETKEKKDPKAK